MSEVASEAQIGAATAYEDLFVPALFREWAPRVVEAARIQAGQHVLDIACGTGILAREAAARVGPTGQVTGVDPAAGMLTVARRLAPMVDFRQGTAESLPFEGRTFDAVVSQFGMMFFSDRRLALREMLRVLAPGGRLAIAVWASLQETPAYAAEVALLERLAGKAAADALRAPFVLGDEGQLRDQLESARVASVTVAAHRGTARFPSIRTLVEADVRGWLPLMGVNLSEAQIAQILEEAETVLRPYRKDDGTVEFESPALIATGTTP